MACVPIPKLPIPELPFPLSIAPPALPDLPLNLDFCCKIINYTVVLPPIPLPPLVLNPAVNAIIAANIKAVQDYLNQLQIPCPTEPVIQP